jgi:hypothetical protein
MKNFIVAFTMLFSLSVYADYVQDLTVPRGGTGQTSFTSGTPLIGNGGSAISQGTVSGNTTEFVTTTGTLTSGHCVDIDSHGNFIDSGAACSAGGSGTVNSGTAGQMAYYATSTNAVSGDADATISAGALTLGVNTTATGSLLLANGAAGGAATTIQPSSSTLSAWSLTLPSSGGSNGYLLSTNGSGVTSWVAPGANTALSNLASVAINTSLLPATAGSANIGSAALPFGTDYEQELDLIGSTSGNVQVKAAAVTTPWTITLPAAVCSSGQYWADNGSGVYSCTTLTTPNVTVTNGGDTAYAILSTDQHIRSGTTLTAPRTYTLPACTSLTIGKKFEIKNLPSQTFNLTVATSGSDMIDGSSTWVLEPGDSVPVVCAVATAWDVE